MKHITGTDMHRKKWGFPSDMQRLTIKTVMKQVELMAGNGVLMF
jgi:hypothetical protein